MKVRNIFWCCALMLMFASCSSTKEVPTLAYFQNLKDSVGKLPDNVSNYKIKIQPDDELIITITLVPGLLLPIGITLLMAVPFYCCTAIWQDALAMVGALTLMVASCPSAIKQGAFAKFITKFGK